MLAILLIKLNFVTNYRVFQEFKSKISRARLELEIEFHIIEFSTNQARTKNESWIFYTSQGRAWKKLKMSTNSNSSLKFPKQVGSSLVMFGSIQFICTSSSQVYAN